jgi:PPP family 3-phenylpropionic acid transporter
MAFGLTAEFYLLILIMIFMAIMRGPIAPIGTALALDHLEGEHRKDGFGALRLWGSLSFVIVSLITGALIIEQSIEAIVWIYSAIMFLLALLSLTLPDAPVSQKVGWRDGALLLKREPILAAFLFGSLFTGMTLGIVNQYLVVYLGDINATGWIIGLALAISALPEVPLMAAVPQMMARWGLAAVLTVGLAVLPVRWLLYTVITNPILVLPTQILHGIGMTALLVVGVIFVDRLLTRNWRATGQALYAAALFGIGPGIGLFSAGLLYERGGIVPVWIFTTLVGLAGLAVVAWAVRAPAGQSVSTERSQP